MDLNEAAEILKKCGLDGMRVRIDRKDILGYQLAKVPMAEGQFPVERTYFIVWNFGYWCHVQIIGQVGVRCNASRDLYQIVQSVCHLHNLENSRPDQGTRELSVAAAIFDLNQTKWLRACIYQGPKICIRWRRKTNMITTQYLTLEIKDSAWHCSGMNDQPTEQKAFAKLAEAVSYIIDATQPK